MAGDVSNVKICKATIAALMGRDPSIIKLDKISGEIIYLSYIRSDDQTKWSTKCRLDGNKVIWATDTGRWRIDPMDSKITFSVVKNTIYIEEKFDDSSSIKKSFNSSKIKD